ncbi:peroxisomal 2,4-dienoyl-coA reductase DecR [Janthinobacterium sp. HH01]|uniref:SDR family oxidoreductase n=1 Tax=Janthinobacterium sp. HH01 TaxID=1198452 RepID=UPI0002AEDECE|nr:SDR family oxidoreductase [Janthinobacterium sp. HH01]ELX08464.1 peroxisomal 2,4-dienoyl-coA reductase DecR [Janthinobacterium sp. HH01]
MKDVFQPNLLAGKAAFITGGGSGINQCIAERMAAAGAAVTIVGRDLAKAQRAAAAINAAGGRAMGLSADVRDYDQVSAALQQAQREFGRLDIVVAGAAGNFVAPAMDMSSKGFRTVIDIDLIGTFNTVHAAHEYLAKPGGLVLAISAVQSTMPTATQSHVCAAKAGVDMLMKTLAVEWGGQGIRCVGIAPGPVGDTEGMRRLAPDGQRSWDRLLGSIPSGRAGAREEIASLALFLASGAADYINGVVLPIDGGQTAVGGHEFGAMLVDSLRPRSTSI